VHVTLLISTPRSSRRPTSNHFSLSLYLAVHYKSLEYAGIGEDEGGNEDGEEYEFPAYLSASVDIMGLSYMLSENMPFSLCDEDVVMGESTYGGGECPEDGTYGFQIQDYALPAVDFGHNYHNLTSWLATGWVGTINFKMYSSPEEDSSLIGYCRLAVNTYVTESSWGAEEDDDDSEENVTVPSAVRRYVRRHLHHPSAEVVAGSLLALLTLIALVALYFFGMCIRPHTKKHCKRFARWTQKVKAAFLDIFGNKNGNDGNDQVTLADQISTRFKRLNDDHPDDDNRFSDTDYADDEASMGTFSDSTSDGSEQQQQRRRRSGGGSGGTGYSSGRSIIHTPLTSPAGERSAAHADISSGISTGIDIDNSEPNSNSGSNVDINKPSSNISSNIDINKKDTVKSRKADPPTPTSTSPRRVPRMNV